MEKLTTLLKENFMDGNDYLFLGYYQGKPYSNVFQELLRAVNKDSSTNLSTIKENAKIIFAFTESIDSKKSSFVIIHCGDYYTFDNYTDNIRSFKIFDKDDNPMEKLSVIRSKIMEYYQDVESQDVSNKMVKKFDKFFGIKNYIRKFDPIKDPFGEENWEEDD